MRVEWERRGLVYSPTPHAPWRQSHAGLPVPVSIGTNRYRVFVSNRDRDNRAHTGWAEVSTAGDFEVVAEAERPSIAPGPLGNFDDHGAIPSCVVEDDGRLLMYYTGWNPGASQPLFYSSIGLASSDDGGISFTRESAAPLLDRSEVDPCLVASPFVIRENGLWRMWYVSGTEWTVVDDTPQSHYHVKYAESEDGINWNRDGLVCIGQREGETNIARPWVLHDGGTYRMWFACAGRYVPGTSSYRIGYAESADGLDWTRLDDEGGLEPADSGWDSGAVAHPAVAADDDRLLLFYNGRGYGREGFGMAEARR